MLERALVARLSSPPAGSPAPLAYLSGVYEKAEAALRRLGSGEGAAEAAADLAEAKTLAVSYAGMAVAHGLFPQPPVAASRGHLQLLDALVATDDAAAGGGLLAGGLIVPPSDAAAAAAGTHGASPLPPGFWEDYCTRWDGEGLADTVEAAAVELGQRCTRASPLGPWRQPLRLLIRLASTPAAARAMVASPKWLPPAGAVGRAAQTATLLGPAFGIRQARAVHGAGRTRRQYPRH